MEMQQANALSVSRSLTSKPPLPKCSTASARRRMRGAYRALCAVAGIKCSATNASRRETRRETRRVVASGVWASGRLGVGRRIWGGGYPRRPLLIYEATRVFQEEAMRINTDLPGEQVQHKYTSN